MRLPTLLIGSLLLGFAAYVPLGMQLAHADGKASRPNTMPVSQIKRGMKGYGLTVFEGTSPTKFDVEVIDVLNNFRPQQDLILVKTFHPRLEVAKVVAGMSGSPIYLNGKMIGAYAYGWSFGKEPVAGVTPISSMLDDLARPLPKAIDGWPLHPLPGKKIDKREAKRSYSRQNRFAGKLLQYDLKQHASQIGKRKQSAKAGAPVAPVATPLLMGGMTSSAIDIAKTVLAPLGVEPLQAGGTGKNDPGAPTRYVDGGAVGVQLIRGDMSAMGLGTVTRVEGDKLVAFGHPMMEAGVTALPTAIGKVLWFLASDMRSFKIGMPVRDVGALVNDRQASIVVSHSAQAPIIPVSMNIKGVAGAPHTKWNFEVAHEKFMTPAFLSIALGSALQATANEHQDVSWNAKSKLTLKDYGTIDIEDFGVAVGGTPEPGDFIRSNLVRALGALMNNPWQPVIVEKVSMEIELRYAREILRLRGVELLDSEVDAGEPARVRITLIPYSGPPQTRVVSIPMPAHMAGKTVALGIQPGYTEQRDLADPDSLGQLVKNLDNLLYPPKSIVISYSTGDGAVSYRGHIAKNLPPGALDLIRPTTSSVAPDSFSAETRIVVPISEFMIGQDKVSVEIKPILR